MHVAGWADGISSILATPPLRLPLETHPNANESGKQEACTHGFVRVGEEDIDGRSSSFFPFFFFFLHCWDSLKDVPMLSLTT